MYVILCGKCEKEWPRDEEKSKVANKPVPAEKCSCGANNEHMVKKTII